MHFFRTTPLIAKLANDELKMQDKAGYLLVGLVWYSIIFYSGLVPVGFPLWSVPSLLEGAVLIVIAIIGVVRAFDAAGGETNRDFVEEFVCLTVPILVTTTLAVWGAYRIFTYMFEPALIALSRSHMQFVVNLAALEFELIGFLTFCVVVGVQAIFYFRIIKAIRAVQYAKNES